jgi:uncharacterized protein (TIGR03066 family)
MRAVLVGVAAAVLVAELGGSADGRQPEKIDAKLLVGKWQPKDDAKKEDFVVEFTKNGKLTVAFGGKDDKAVGTYKLDGDKLILKLKFGDKEKDQTRTIHSLTRTELVSSPEDGGSKDTLVRIPGKKDKKE